MTNWTEAELNKLISENKDVKVFVDGLDCPIDVQIRYDKCEPVEVFPELAEPRFKSTTERQAWHEFLPTLEPAHMEYEPLTLKIDGANYTPDFVLVMPSREMWLIECKGSGSWQAYKSGRSSKRSLKQCSRHFAWMGRFFSLIKIPKKEGGGWDFQEII